jgi:hypothetical protein
MLDHGLMLAPVACCKCERETLLSFGEQFRACEGEWSLRVVLTLLLQCPTGAILIDMVCDLKSGTLGMAAPYIDRTNTITVNGVVLSNQPTAAACSSSCNGGGTACVVATAFCCINISPSGADLPSDGFTDPIDGSTDP